MIFSVQNNNLTYSVEFLPGMMTIKVLESVSGIFLAQMDVPNQVWRMIEITIEHHSELLCNNENDVTECTTSWDGLSRGS